jgi:predicted ester cyclase
MTPDQNKEIVTRFNKEVIEGKNVALFHEIMDAGFFNHAALPGVSPAKDGMLHFLQNILWKGFSDITIEIHDMIAERDKVTTRKTIHGTHVGEFLSQPASGKKIQIHVIDIIRLTEGRYLEHWRVWNPLEVINQINGSV